MELTCAHASICSGCSHWGDPLKLQRQRKQTRFLELLRGRGLREPRELIWADLPGHGLRDRLDFQIQEGRFGLWNKDRSRIEDLFTCEQLSPQLKHWHEKFREFRFPVRRGSVRLRVNSRGDKGVWLDLANEDVKFLFDERETLERLSRIAEVVEIGQRRKRLVFENGAPKLLKDPHYHVWSETWIDGEPLALKSRIGDFSQVGRETNRAIIQALESVLPDSEHLVEFGSGTGNLTFPSAARCERVDAYEFDASAAAAFEINRASFGRLRPQAKLQLRVGNFQNQAAALSGVDTVLVNPPRSGVGDFLESLPGSHVERLVYMSCFPESMTADLAKTLAGWNCEKLILIDQFPQTEHLEVMGLWTR